MVVSKKTLNKNGLLGNNISLFSKEYPDIRALVLKEELLGLEEFPIKDYYHIVVLETSDGLISVPEPDFLFWQDGTPYKDSVLSYPDLFRFEKTTLVSNWRAVNKLKYMDLEKSTNSVNYLPSDEGSSEEPNIERISLSGLNQNEPGVHFSLILGATKIYYTGSSENATTVDLNDITSFIAEKEKFYPKNLIRLNRQTVSNEYY